MDFKYGHLEEAILGLGVTPALDELVDHGSLGPDAARFLAAAVTAGLSIVIAGAPGSGKTTLLSCCAAELDPSRRVVIAEEVFEADVPLPRTSGGEHAPAGRTVATFRPDNRAAQGGLLLPRSWHPAAPLRRQTSPENVN
jgi:energy-coupling factor transporter ATP-binding protein EcfA2